MRVLIVLFLSTQLLSTLVCCMAASSSTPIKYSLNELREFDRAWDEIRSSCCGCWSGSISTYAVELGRRYCRLRMQSGSRERNFRLQVQFNDDNETGTWTVWNLNHVGDQVVVPLSRIPSFDTRPSQLKIGFEGGCILRIPRNWFASYPLVWEIGFWNNGMRRTAVAEYTVPWRKGCARKLNKLAIVQMKAIPTNGFVGSMTDDEAIPVLPLEAPFTMQDLQFHELVVEPITRESIDLLTMNRHVDEALVNRDDEERARAVLERLLLGERKDRLTQVLPNGLCMSIPSKLTSDRAVTCIFGHYNSHHGIFQAIEVTYDANIADATRVTMYTYQRPKRL